MSDPVPASHRDLLRTTGFAFLATLGPSGAPQVSPTWYGWDPERGQLLVSLTRTRRKYRNLRADPRLAVCIPDPGDPYRYVELRGRVVSLDPDPGRRFINELTRRYVGLPEHTRDGPEEVRVIVRMDVDRALVFG